MADKRKPFNPAFSRDALDRLLKKRVEGAEIKVRGPLPEKKDKKIPPSSAFAVNMQQTVTEAQGYLDKVKGYLTDCIAKKSDIRIITKRVNKLVEVMPLLVNTLEVLGEQSAVNRAETLQKKLESVQTAISNTRFSRLSELKETMSDLKDASEKIQINVDKYSYLDEMSKTMEDIKETPIPKTDQPAAAFSAPIVLILKEKLPTTVKNALEKEYGMKQVSFNYCLIPNAKMLLVNTSMLKKEDDPEKKAKELTTTISKRSKDKIIPIADIAMTIGKSYVCWIAYETDANAIETLLQAMETYKLYVKEG